MHVARGEEPTEPGSFPGRDLDLDRPDGSWRKAVLPSEAPRKMRWVAEAYLKGDLGHCPGVREQKVVGALQAEAAEKIPCGTTGESHQFAVQLCPAEANLATQSLDRESLVRKMAIGDGDGPLQKVLLA